MAEQHLSVQRVLTFLLEQTEPVTRPLVADACDLSRPTVFAAIARLEDSGLVEADGQRSGKPGRSAALYQITRAAGVVAGLDIGGSNLRVAITDVRGQLLGERREPTAQRGGQQIVSQAVDLIRSVLHSTGATADALAAVGVSVPGVVGADGSTVYYASNIDQFEPFDFRTPLRAAMNAPVLLDNNVNLAAMGERWQGVAHDLETFAVVAVGAGVGAGIVHEGGLLRGAHGAAGEVAFLPPHSCHRKIDASAHDQAGGLSLLQHAQTRPGWQGRPPTTVEELFLRAAEREEPAATLVEEECARIASIIASICAVVDLETVILTGGVGVNDRLIARAEQLAEELTLFPPAVIRSGLGERASLIGAVRLATQSVRADLIQAVADSGAAPRVPIHAGRAADSSARP